jgi:hypothetical protein
MKRTRKVLCSLFSVILAVSINTAHAQSTGPIIGWGEQVIVEQAALDSLIAVAGGYGHSLGLKVDGSIVVWGSNNYGECNVPALNADFIAVAGGFVNSLGLKVDGSIVAWGSNNYGECNVPTPNEDFIAVAGGDERSLGLRSTTATAVEEPRPGNKPEVAKLSICSLSPNPFNPSTEVTFEALVSGPVILNIYDVTGQRITTVALGDFEPGLHRAKWDGRGCEWEKFVVWGVLHSSCRSRGGIVARESCLDQVGSVVLVLAN